MWKQPLANNFYSYGSLIPVVLPWQGLTARRYL